MKQVETTQITFGKQAKKMIKDICPTAKFFVKINKDFVIKDGAGVTVATWHKQRNKNGLIVIH